MTKWREASQAGADDIDNITQQTTDRIQTIWDLHFGNMRTKWQKWYEDHTKFVTKQATSLATSTHTMWKTFFFDAMTGEFEKH